MKKTLRSRYGPIRPLKRNPRRITQEAFAKLCESIERDPDFMRINRIKVDENGVVLGGNQRFKALQTLGYDEIPDDWITRVEHADGSPFSQDEKDRLVLIDNSPEGISGSFDFSEIVDGFSLDLLRDCGMDLSKIDMPEQDRIGFEGRAETELEHSEIGEESETLKDLHRKRAVSKKKFEDMSDFGFYSVLVFQDNAQRKAFGEWCAAHGVPMKYEGLYVNGEEFADKAGIEVPPCTGTAIRERLPNAVLESMTLDGNPGNERAKARSSSHRETLNPDEGA